jgi:hypothetical protein
MNRVEHDMDSPASPVEVTGFRRLYTKFFPPLLKPLPNPGKFEDINHESKGTHCDDMFEGLKFSLGRNFTHFGMVHNLHFKPGAIGPHGGPVEHAYDLDLNFQSSGTGLTFAAATRTNKKGEVNAQIVVKPSDEITLSFPLSLPGNAEGSVARACAQVEGKSFMLTGNIGKPQQCEVSLLQSVTEKLSVGGLANLASQQNPMTGEIVQASSLALGARYNAEKWIGHCMFTPTSATPHVSASYTHRIKDLGHLSVEMEHFLSPYPRDALVDAQKVTFGLDLKNNQTNNRFRAFVNSHGVVGSMLELSMNANCRVSLGLQMDHTHSEFKYAIHFNIMSLFFIY